jgi:hypothetical protein
MFLLNLNFFVTGHNTSHQPEEPWLPRVQKVPHGRGGEAQAVSEAVRGEVAADAAASAAASESAKVSSSATSATGESAQAAVSSVSAGRDFATGMLN